MRTVGDRETYGAGQAAADARTGGGTRRRGGRGTSITFISDKARRAGVSVVYVDPAYTSRTCAECGHVDKANRVSQAWFACRNCGFVDHADRNGSRNIRARAWELWRRGVQSSQRPLPFRISGWPDAGDASQPVMPATQAQ